MIVLPALGAIVAAVAPLVEAALIGAGIGAALSGAACGIGGAVSGIHEHGSIDKEIAVSTAHRAAECAAEGALVGGITGPVVVVVAPVVAPAAQVIDDVARPVFHIADNVARPVFQAADDAVRPVMQAVDDAVRPLMNKVGESTKSVGKAIAAPFNHARNALNARFFNHLPKTSGSSGYVYVIDDVRYAGRYKIGMTNDPARRHAELQKQLGRRLDFTCIIPTSNMRMLESAIHATFASQNLPNTGTGQEFFRLNPVQVAAACSH